MTLPNFQILKRFILLALTGLLVLTNTYGMQGMMRHLIAQPSQRFSLSLICSYRWHSINKKPEFAISTTDIGFKQLLDPADQELLISFLNTFVPPFAHDPVQEVQPCSVVIPALPKEGDRKEKATFMDLHVQARSGTKYIIEMQARRHILFDERALFYLCNTYGRQLSEAQMRKKDWYRSLKPTIAIQVLDYDSNRIQGIQDKDLEDTQLQRVQYHPLPEGEYLKHYMMKDSRSHQQLTHIQMVQVELPRYITRPLFPHQKNFTPVEWWLSILRHSSQYTQQYIDQLTTQNIDMPPIIQKDFNRLRYSQWNPEMQREYQLQVQDREQFEVMYAVERAEGRKEEQLKIVKRMIAKGKSNEDIVEVIEGLSLDEIEEIRKQMEIDKKRPREE